ncbi:MULTISPECIES: hypothetical protein [Bacillales]|uniref:hypothetical protein n=1 Tax=Bacillales TaxID=1385 RepID=UPI00037E85D1|nr:MULTISPECIES: hypothetical protein [Bacillales]KMZ41329.1 hypothetical protein AC624_09615 [Bacillus sp. FJAT-27238]
MDTAWIGVLGVLGASILTSLFNLWNNRQKTKSEKEQIEVKRIWGREDRELGYKQERYESELRTYNEILKADGELQYVTINEQNGLNLFKIDKFRERVRPIIFKDFHRLPPDIRKLAREIDRVSSEYDYYDTSDEWHDHLAAIYSKMIIAIEEKYQDFDKTAT